MIPKRSINVDCAIPELVEYWVPDLNDINEEGYGLYIHDAQVILGVEENEALNILEWERAATTWASEWSSDEYTFEQRARVAESYDSLDELEGSDEASSLPSDLRNSQNCLMGLDLGVSGLSHALAATGFYPVASCRSHFDYSWSSVPVVLFATEEARLFKLQRLISLCGCGLESDESRGQPLFSIYAPSIVNFMDLAHQILANGTKLQ